MEWDFSVPYSRTSTVSYVCLELFINSDGVPTVKCPKKKSLQNDLILAKSGYDTTEDMNDSVEEMTVYYRFTSFKLPIHEAVDQFFSCFCENDRNSSYSNRHNIVLDGISLLVYW